MKLLWLTWKDLTHPLAGGAEVVNEELAKRLAADGHEVILLVGGYKGMVREETINRYKVIRFGNRYTVYWHVWRYYRRHLRGWADLVIDEVNTVPFFAKLYVKEPNLLFVHMLAREIWFYQMIFPVSLLGYLIEPLYMRLLRDRRVITISESTKQDLLRQGFNAKNIQIISEGIEMVPVRDLEKIAKYSRPTLLSLGSIRPMKRTLHQLKAFEIAKQTMPDLQLKVAGRADSPYGRYFLWRMKHSKYRQDIEYCGPVSQAKKVELMQRSHLILVTSIKEGWGLIVTEAASQGTPAIVYDVDGLRDSVQDQKTGLLTSKQSAKELAKQIQKSFARDDAYAKIRRNAWQASKQVTFKNAYQALQQIIL